MKENQANMHVYLTTLLVLKRQADVFSVCQSTKKSGQKTRKYYKMFQSERKIKKM